MEKYKVNLRNFDGSNFDKGAGFFKTVLWYFVNALIVRASWNPFMGIKIALLRAFGAKIGKGLVIKNNVVVKSPWNLVVGDDCFGNVSDARIIGLNQLESVVVGKNSFTKHKNGSIKNRNSKFYLMNCPMIRELKMGCYSFSDYSLCMIENVPSLEAIERGRLNAESFNFYYANFQLKSHDDRNVLRVDLPRLKTLLLGGKAFCQCTTVSITGMGHRMDSEYRYA